jgi:hypothetical protein
MNNANPEIQAASWHQKDLMDALSRPPIVGAKE